MKNKGFMLVEAIAAIVVVSVCLTLIAQAMLTNFRTGLRFQESVAPLLSMENMMGFVHASPRFVKELTHGSYALEEPYGLLTAQGQVASLEVRPRPEGPPGRQRRLRQGQEVRHRGFPG